MVGVAVAARFYFLDVCCPGCRQLKQVEPMRMRPERLEQKEPLRQGKLVCSLC
jgi:hypothetical protein